MSGDVSTTEARRFTAIGFMHPSLRPDVKSIRDALGPSLGQVRKIDVGPDGWHTFHCEYERITSLYPADLVEARSRMRKSGRYAHDIFISLFDYGSLGSVMWVASPYIKLLDEIHSEASKRLIEPALQYTSANMKGVFALLAQGADSIAVKRVILRIISEENVELVSLTGKMPLHSDIHRGLSQSTLPYGVGAVVEFEDQRARVTVNRTGLVHWFQSEVKTLGCALSLVSMLSGADLLHQDRRYPLSEEAQKAISSLED